MWFTEDNRPDGQVRKDASEGCLQNEPASKEVLWMGLLRHLSFEFIDPQSDFALLKVDF
jgi:hypothetical protein